MNPNAYMFTSVSEDRAFVRRPGRTTAVMITHNCRFDLFALSLLSLFLRTEPYDYLDGVFVIVNGPRFSREPDLSDRKLAFLHDLSFLDFKGRPVPLGVFRVWGVGGPLTHSPCLDSAMSFITTEHTLSMHDDVLIRDRDWPRAVKAVFEHPRVALAAAPHLLMCRCQETSPPAAPERKVLLVPHPNTCFLSCKTDTMFELGQRWLGYCSTLPGGPYTSRQLEPDFEDMVAFYKGIGLDVEDKVLDPERQFYVVGHDVGAWYLNALWRNGMAGVSLGEELVSHVVSASWHPPGDVDDKLKGEFKGAVESVDEEVRGSVFKEVYEKHLALNG